MTSAQDFPPLWERCRACGVSFRITDAHHCVPVVVHTGTIAARTVTTPETRRAIHDDPHATCNRLVDLIASKALDADDRKMLLDLAERLARK